MINRIEDFLPARDSPRVSEGSEPARTDAGNFEKLAALPGQWIERHPAACLAAAFALGVAVAWIIKRK